MVAEKARIAQAYDKKVTTVTSHMKLLREDPTRKLRFGGGRPRVTTNLTPIVSILAETHSKQRATRSKALPVLLLAQAKKEAVERGKPSHSVSQSSRTIERRRKEILGYEVSEVKPQKKPEVRTLSENSARALASLYGLSDATMGDVHPELITNTDKTQYHYNMDLDSLGTVFKFHGDQIPTQPTSDKKKRTSKKKQQKKRKLAHQLVSKPPTTLTGSSSRHLPQRIFATVSCNSMGAAGPVIFTKPIADLGYDGIVKIPFRNLSIYPGTGPEHQAQLWLYDPKCVTKDQEWLAYYLDVYLPFVRRLHASVFTEPTLDQAEPPVEPLKPQAANCGRCCSAGLEADVGNCAKCNPLAHSKVRT
jgi:hypothetical protein